MRVRFLSLGCRVNQYEAQALEGFFHKTASPSFWMERPTFLSSTPGTVTSAADHKSRQAVRRCAASIPVRWWC